MVEAISHLIHRDYEAIVEDFVTLQFIDPGTNLQPILPVLAKVGRLPALHSCETTHTFFLQHHYILVLVSFVVVSSAWPLIHKFCQIILAAPKHVSHHSGSLYTHL